MTRAQVVIPMAGTGQRFKDAGYKEIKPLLDVAGRPLISRLIEKFPRDWRFVFVCNEEHLKTTRLSQVLLAAAPEAEIVAIAPHKLGPVHTVREGFRALRDDLPTFVNYCDFSFSWDPAHFLDFAALTECDGALLCYRGFHPHALSPTLYAYCREEGGRVKEVREKGHFTPDRSREYASSGTYFFGSGALARKYFAVAEDSGPNHKGEYYVSLVYNPMIADGLDVRVYEIPRFLQWGTPEDLEDYLYWHRAFERLAHEEAPPPSGPRLVMPMAGLGSRFAAGGTPKPLIPVAGRPMFLAARARLPCGPARPVVVLRRELEADVRAAAGDAELVVLDAPTSGQAETTLAAAPALATYEPVLVSACDHGLLWDRAEWERLIATGPDVVVVGQRGYPDARRSPNSYAYIDAAADGRVRRVSVKVPLSPNPTQDLVLTGTFYFRRADLMSDLIHDLKRRDMRVNGELYLDSVANLCVERGLDVRCFESASYLNWGSPAALGEFRYWYDHFLGVTP
ncbi:MAG: NTP transferase domain-containing protein [Elusimicrobiota bacterium]